MTQQEALKELENLTIDYGKRTAEEIERLDEAVDMAMAALRANAVDRQTCEDAVSRQAAIKTLEKGLPSEPLKSKYTEGITVGFGLAITWIEQLPAVQSQPIVRCKDCRFQDKGRNESESWNLCRYRPWLHVPTEDEHYCGYAERRIDEQTD